MTGDRRLSVCVCVCDVDPPAGKQLPMLSSQTVEQKETHFQIQTFQWLFTFILSCLKLISSHINDITLCQNCHGNWFACHHEFIFFFPPHLVQLVEVGRHQADQLTGADLIQDSAGQLQCLCSKKFKRSGVSWSAEERNGLPRPLLRSKLRKHDVTRRDNRHPRPIILSAGLFCFVPTTCRYMRDAR